MHHHGHHEERGRHHHHHGASHDHGRHAPARHHDEREAYRVTVAGTALAAGALAGPGHASATQLLPSTPEASSSLLMSQALPAEGCPKTGSSGQCLGECRTCANRGL